jgi:hypothetical protein
MAIGESSHASERRVQQDLIESGYDFPRFGPDGVYVDETATAVSHYKSDRVIVPTDRVVDPQVLLPPGCCWRSLVQEVSQQIIFTRTSRANRCASSIDNLTILLGVSIYGQAESPIQNRLLSHVRELITRRRLRCATWGDDLNIHVPASGRTHSSNLCIRIDGGVRCVRIAKADASCVSEA